MYAVRGKLAFPESATEVVNQAIEAGEVDAADVDPSDPLGFLVGPGARPHFRRGVLPVRPPRAGHRFGVDRDPGTIGHLAREHPLDQRAAPSRQRSFPRLDHTLRAASRAVIGDSTVRTQQSVSGWVTAEVSSLHDGASSNRCLI